MKFSLDLIHKPIINADHNEIMGRIHGYVLDPEERRVAGFVLEQQEEGSSFHVVPFSATKTIYNDAVLIEGLPGPVSLNDAPELMDLLMRDVVLLGVNVITDTGMLAGSVRDFAFSVETGKLCYMRLSPEKGFPEFFDAERMLKIARERIIVSASVCDPALALAAKKAVAFYLKHPEMKPPGQAASAAPEMTVKPVVPPSPAELASSAPVSETGVPVADPAPPPPVAVASPTAPESSTPRVDAMRLRMTLEEFKKDFVEELEVLYNSHFKEQLRTSFQEALRLLFDRLSHLEPEKQFDKFREQMSVDVREMLHEAEEQRRTAEREQTIESALDDRLGQLVDARVAAAEKRLEGLESAIGELAARHADSSESMRAELSLSTERISGAAGETAGRIFDAMRELSKGVESAVTAAADRASKPSDIESAVESLRAEFSEKLSSAIETTSAVKAELENMRAEDVSAAIREEIAAVSSSIDLEGRIAFLRESLTEEIREANVAEQINSVSVSLRDELEGVRGSIADIGRTLNNMSGLGALIEKISDETRARTDEISLKAPSAEKMELLLGELKSELNASLPELLGEHFQALQERIDGMAARALSAETLEWNVEKLRNELSVSLPDMLRRNFSEIKAAADAIERKMPSTERFDRTVESLREEFALTLPELMQKQAEELKRHAEDLAANLSTTESIDHFAEYIKEEFACILVEVLQKHLDSAAQHAEAIVQHLPPPEAFTRISEKLKEEFSINLPLLLDKYFTDAKKVSDALAERLPSRDDAEKAAFALRDELTLSLTDMVQREVEEVRRAVVGVEEKLPPADALEKSADKLKYELSLILPELLQKNFEELRGHTDALGVKIETALPEQFEELKHRADELADRVPSADSLRAELDGFRSDISEKLDAVREAGAGVEENLRKAVFDALAQFRNAQGVEIQSILLPIGNTLDFLKEQPGLMEAMVAGGAESVNKALSEATASIGEQLASLASRDVTSRFDAVASSQQELRGLLEGASEKFERRISDVRSDVENTLRAEFAKHADSTLERAADIRDSIRKIEERVAAAIAQDAPPDFSALRDELLDEFRSMTSSTVKSEELQELRNRVESAIESLSRTATAEARENVNAAIAELKNVMVEPAVDAGQIKNDISEISDKLRESFRDKFDSLGLGIAARFEKMESRLNEKELSDAAAAEGVGGRESADRLAERVEKRLREDMDKMAEFVDRRISERDEYLEDAFRKFAEAVEGLATRARGGDIGDLFSGRLFGNLFGGAQQPKLDSRRIPPSAGQPRKPVGSSGVVEAAQVRRLSYLIGKTVTKDILDGNGVVVVHAGETVGEETIRTARDSHRVLDLIRMVDLASE